MTKEEWAARIADVVLLARADGFEVGVTDTEDWGSGMDLFVGTGDIWISGADRVEVGVESTSTR